MEALKLEALLPGSALQEGLWLLEHVSGAQPLVRSALQIRGALDIRRLRQSIAAVVARHELLGCGFRSVRDRLVRFRAAPVSNVLRVIDVSALPARTPQQWMDVL